MYGKLISQNDPRGNSELHLILQYFKPQYKADTKEFYYPYQYRISVYDISAHEMLLYE